MSAAFPNVLDNVHSLALGPQFRSPTCLGRTLGARSWMVEATSGRLVGAVWLEPSDWNSDKWISHWALAGKGDTYWWRGFFPAATATTVASQAKILGPVGNEHVENEHAGGLTALRLRELRRKEHG